MTKVSTARKLGVVGRVAMQQVKRTRTFRAMRGAAAAAARSLGKVLHQLWLEVMGVVFLLMAASGVAGFVHEYTKYRAGQAGFGRVATAICFTVTFAWFGVSSFWRVRRKGKGAQ